MGVNFLSLTMDVIGGVCLGNQLLLAVASWSFFLWHLDETNFLDFTQAIHPSAHTAENQNRRSPAGAASSSSTHQTEDQPEQSTPVNTNETNI